jgi:hypothetical protein
MSQCDLKTMDAFDVRDRLSALKLGFSSCAGWRIPTIRRSAKEMHQAVPGSSRQALRRRPLPPELPDKVNALIGNSSPACSPVCLLPCLT